MSLDGCRQMASNGVEYALHIMQRYSVVCLLCDSRSLIEVVSLKIFQIRMSAIIIILRAKAITKQRVRSKRTCLLYAKFAFL